MGNKWSVLRQHRIVFKNFHHVANPFTVSFIFSYLLFVPESPAQQTNPTTGSDQSSGVEARRNEFGVWGGISFDTFTLIGKTPSARFGNIGLRYSRVLIANQSVAFSWTIDVVPVAVLSNNRFTVEPTGSGSFIFQQTRVHAFGAGLSPIGLKLNFRHRKNLQPFASGSGGGLYFSKKVPQRRDARFNFTIDLEGGIQIVRDSRHAITLGYKYQHISNGNRAPDNPGVDVQMIFAGFSIFK